MVGFCVPADEAVGAGDRYIARELAQLRTPVLALVTKIDTVKRDAVGRQLLAVQQLGQEVGLELAEIVPVSATAGIQLDLLIDLLVARLPPGPPLYLDGELTDEPEQAMVAELVREAALDGVRDELPHSLAVQVEEMVPREDRPADRPLLDIRAIVYVERSSQKAIVIGKQGARLKDVGTRARTADRGPPRHPGLSRSPRQDRQGLAARPQTAPQARLLAAPGMITFTSGFGPTRGL